MRVIFVSNIKKFHWREIVWHVHLQLWNLTVMLHSQFQYLWAIINCHYFSAYALFTLRNWWRSIHQVEKDRLLLKIELARAGKPWGEIDNGDDDQVSIKNIGGDYSFFYCLCSSEIIWCVCFQGYLLGHKLCEKDSRARSTAASIAQHQWFMC